MVQAPVLSEDKFLVCRYRLPSVSTQLESQVGADAVTRNASSRLPCVIADFTLRGEFKELVLTHAMTRVQDDPLAYYSVLICRVVVKTVVGHAPVLQHSKHAWAILWDVNIGVNIIQVPPEALTAQLFSQLPPLCHVSKGLLETKPTNDGSTM